jgi:hypothetical protein
VALEKLTQSSWAAGMVEAGAHEFVPPTGAFDLKNLLIGDDGLPYKRGGTAYKSNASFGSTGLRNIMDVALAGGHRTCFYNADDFGMLDPADDVTPLTVKAGLGASFPNQWALLNDLLLFEYDNYPNVKVAAFGGSKKTSNYSTGTVTLTQGSFTVTGSGTSWLANADAGMIFRRDPGAGTTRLVGVQSVESNTSLTLSTPWSGDNYSGVAYTLYPIYTALPVWTLGPAGMTTISNRYVFGYGTSLYYSDIDQPLGVPKTNRHDFPSTLLGLASLRDELLVFTTGGVWVISGMANDLTDPAGNPLRRQERVNDSMVLWRRNALARWRESLIVCALDGVWVMDSVSTPHKISAAINDLYSSYINGGYWPGTPGVFNDHLFLPILDGSAQVVDCLVCRLVESRAGGPFAWTRFNGAGMNVGAFTERRSTQFGGLPLLLGAGRASTSRVIDCRYLFPSGTYKNDHDGSFPTAEIQTADFPTGNLVPNTVRKVRFRHATIDAASDNPYWTLDYQADGSGSWTAVSGSAFEDDGTNPHTWLISPAKKARFIRYRLQLGNQAATSTLKSIETFYRPTGKF